MSRLMIRKAARALNLFSLDRPEWGVSEAAKELGIPKSTACELLISLTDQRLLRRTGKGRYRLGWRLFELSQILTETTEFRTGAREVMRELVDRLGETAHLAVLDGVQAVYLEKLQPHPKVKIMISWRGARLSAHCSGLGKVLLAHSEWEEIAELLQHQGLPALTPNTISDLDELASELEEIRERGYAYDIEETLIGLCCVAAPIYDSTGGVVAAVSLSVPSVRFDQNIDTYTAAILGAARRISVSAGHKEGMYMGHKKREENLHAV